MRHKVKHVHFVGMCGTAASREQMPVGEVSMGATGRERRRPPMRTRELRMGVKA